MRTSTDTASTSLDDAVAINNVLETFIERKTNSAAEISPFYQDLWLEVARLARSGGKRLRSRLVLLGYRAFGGGDIGPILPAAAAMELLHQGMLIHDDIIDRDYIRYGVENIAGHYNRVYGELVEDEADRMHYAHSVAILAGDLMISESYLLVSESKVAAEKIIAVQRLLNQSIFEVVGGELLDTEAAFRDSSLINPEVVAMYKTASYTFALPLLVGAELAGASVASQAYIRDFARSLGIAFQLRDDIIGVFGDETKTGKSSSGDIREGKHTFMVERFYELCSPQQKQEFNALFGNHVANDDEVEFVRQMLKDTGSLEATEKAITSYEQKARIAWGSINTDPNLASQIDELIAVATKRKS